MSGAAPPVRALRAEIAGVGLSGAHAGGRKPAWPDGAPPRLRSWDALCVAGGAAALEAVAAARWPAAALAGERVALVLGTAFGSHATNQDYYQGVLGHGPVSPRLFTYTLPSCPLGELSIHWKQTGPQLALSAGWASGAAALDVALGALATGAIDRAVCVAADVPAPATLAALEAVARGVPASGGVALALRRAGAGALSAGAARGAPDAAAVAVSGCALGWADPAHEASRSERAAEVVAAACAAAGRSPASVERVVLACTPALGEAAAAALVRAGVGARVVADAARAEDAAVRCAMGASPLLAVARLAAHPQPGPRVDAVISLCYSGALAALVVERT